MKMVIPSKNYISEIIIIILAVSFNACNSYPMRHRQPGQPVEITTTPKKVKDTFQLNKQVMPIPRNDTKKIDTFKSNLVGKSKYEDFGNEPVTYKVKAVDLGEKTMRQSEDDDDDDDGGEYDGNVEYGNCKKEDLDHPQQKPNSMPMMIIREVDVMAMDIPMKDGKKQDSKNGWSKYQKPVVEDSCNGFGNVPNDVPKDTLQDVNGLGEASKEQYRTEAADKNKKEWGEWSVCSKTCGEGTQTRSRLKASGGGERITQTRKCQVSKCQPETARFNSAQIKYSP